MAEEEGPWVWIALSVATVAAMAAVGLFLGLSRLSAHVNAVELDVRTAAAAARRVERLVGPL